MEAPASVTKLKNGIKCSDVLQIFYFVEGLRRQFSVMKVTIMGFSLVQYNQEKMVGNSLASLSLPTSSYMLTFTWSMLCKRAPSSVIEIQVSNSTSTVAGGSSPVHRRWGRFFWGSPDRTI